MNAAICPRCGNPKQRADWVACFGCLVTFDERAIRDFAAARDELRAWLDDAARWLEDNKGAAVWDRAFARYRKREATYKALCWLLMDVAPEIAAVAA